MRVLLLGLILLTFASPLQAQEAATQFDAAAFEQELDAALATAGQSGVSVTAFANALR